MMKLKRGMRTVGRIFLLFLLQGAVICRPCVAEGDATRSRDQEERDYDHEAARQSELDAVELPVRLDAPWVRQLAETQPTNAVVLLEKAFLRRQKEMGETDDRFLDAEILIALGSIPGRTARDVLHRLFQEVMAHGPRYKEHWRDERYLVTMHAAIRQLGLAGDPDSQIVLRQVAETPGLLLSVRSQAYQWSLIYEMKKQEVGGHDETVRWLYAEYAKQGGMVGPAFVTLGIERMLSRIGADVLPILKQMEGEISAEYGTEYWGARWLRCNATNISFFVKYKKKFPEPGEPYWRKPRHRQP